MPNFFPRAPNDHRQGGIGGVRGRLRVLEVEAFRSLETPLIRRVVRCPEGSRRSSGRSPPMSKAMLAQARLGYALCAMRQAQ